MDYDDILRSINKKLGPPPRTFTFIDKLSWFRRDKPEWDWQNDDLRHNIENSEKVFQGRKAYLGAYHPGEFPAVCLISCSNLP
jgi:hypothetical protein